MSIKVKTGQKAPVSGQYYNPKTKTEVTLVKDKKVPPTSAGGATFTLIDKTKHKN